MGKVHVAVLGDAFCDIIAGPLTAMPRWGADLECPHISQLAGGSALNVAVHLGALCGSNETRSCSFHGLVGNDPFGDFLRRRLADVGVEDAMESAEAAGTGVCIVLSGQDDRGFVTQVGATGLLGTEHLSCVKKKIGDAGFDRVHVHVGGYYSCGTLRPGLVQFLGELRAEAESSGVALTVSLDTNCDASETWKGLVGEGGVLREVDLFLPNEVEATAIAQAENLPAAADALAAEVRPGGAVVITCGADGAMLQTRAGAEARSAARRLAAPRGITPVDPTGAGDAFDAGFVFQWAVCGGPPARPPARLFHPPAPGLCCPAPMCSAPWQGRWRRRRWPARAQARRARSRAGPTRTRCGLRRAHALRARAWHAALGAWRGEGCGSRLPPPSPPPSPY